MDESHPQTQPEHTPPPSVTINDLTDVERVRLAARDLIAELFRVIEQMCEPFDRCRYDHHDQCQEHYLHERPCPWDRARVLLDELHEADGA